MVYYTEPNFTLSRAASNRMCYKACKTGDKLPGRLGGKIHPSLPGPCQLMRVCVRARQERGEGWETS